MAPKAMTPSEKMQTECCFRLEALFGQGMQSSCFLQSKRLAGR